MVVTQTIHKAFFASSSRARRVSIIVSGFYTTSFPADFLAKELDMPGVRSHLSAEDVS